ncbi:hypothetical protein [Lacticaseibacillus hulanensis]|uniref:hypothetical protein n=1 Tax=Lacticaseibacillus hulanensis TaxID=2493111 RepID=UPI000FD8DEE0|nr:hypothetical protein [Lacticaseibacillus hulanensis]
MQYQEKNRSYTTRRCKFSSPKDLINYGVNFAETLPLTDITKHELSILIDMSIHLRLPKSLRECTLAVTKEGKYYIINMRPRSILRALNKQTGDSKLHEHNVYRHHFRTEYGQDNMTLPTFYCNPIQTFLGLSGDVSRCKCWICLESLRHVEFTHYSYGRKDPNILSLRFSMYQRQYFVEFPTKIQPAKLYAELDNIQGIELAYAKEKHTNPKIYAFAQLPKSMAKINKVLNTSPVSGNESKSVSDIHQKAAAKYPDGYKYDLDQHYCLPTNLLPRVTKKMCQNLQRLAYAETTFFTEHSDTATKLLKRLQEGRFCESSQIEKGHLYF